MAEALQHERDRVLRQGAALPRRRRVAMGPVEAEARLVRGARDRDGSHACPDDGPAVGGVPRNGETA